MSHQPPPLHDDGAAGVEALQLVRSLFAEVGELSERQFVDNMRNSVSNINI